ncbi:MAG: hypothetical protein C0625_12420 [Arcobacter sp.]|nr:MAG: hypothetical protein C0625_12420 [Arcobacter sp.]
MSLKKYKKWANILIITCFVLLLLVITTNYFVDPFQQYRKANFYTFKTDKPRYLNAGLAKNYDYDSILVGSSMVENFYANDIEKFLGFRKLLKLATRGGTIFEEVKTIENALLSNKNLKNILMGLDVYAFSELARPTKQDPKFPEYLYDNNILNDTPYLLNFNVLKESIEAFSSPYDKEKISNTLNTLYEWQSLYSEFFTAWTFKNDYNSWYKKFIYEEKLTPGIVEKTYRFEILKERFDNVFLPIVKNNKEKEFYLFFPPYSIVQYKTMEMGNYFDDHLKFKEYIFENLKDFKNVKLYDFQIEKSITHNLDNYKDLTHYSDKINYWMLEQMSKNKYLVTSQNLKEYSNTLNKQTKVYDLEKGLNRK